MLKQVAVSIVASMLLAQNPLSAEVLQCWKDSSSEFAQTKSAISQYESLSHKVCQVLDIAIYQLCQIHTKLNDKEKQEFAPFLQILKEAQKVAIVRVEQDNLQCDREVLYYILSTIHILESVLDDEFLALSEGYKKPQDVYMFGKGLYDLSKANS